MKQSDLKKKIESLSALPKKKYSDTSLIDDFSDEKILKCFDHLFDAHFISNYYCDVTENNYYHSEWVLLKIHA